MIRFVGYFLFCVGLLCAGCYNMDAEAPTHATRDKLTLIGKVLERLTEQDRLQIQNIAEFVVLAEKRRLIAGRNYFEQDGWRQIFEWRVDKDGDRTVIRVISIGRNGIFENGGGDDVELQFTEGKFKIVPKK